MNTKQIRTTDTAVRIRRHCAHCHRLTWHRVTETAGWETLTCIVCKSVKVVRVS